MRIKYTKAVVAVRALPRERLEELAVRTLLALYGDENGAETMLDDENPIDSGADFIQEIECVVGSVGLSIERIAKA